MRNKKCLFANEYWKDRDLKCKYYNTCSRRKYRDRKGGKDATKH